jgi:hypothetical protein
MVPVFERRDSFSRARDRIIHILRRFPQEQGAIQDGKSFKEADHKRQAIDVREVQNRYGFAQFFCPVSTGLHVELAPCVAGIVVVDTQNQANRISYDHSASPDARESPGYGALAEAVSHSIDETAVCHLGIRRQLQRKSKEIGHLCYE